MKKYCLILLFTFITLILLVSCDDITLTYTLNEKEEPEITDYIESTTGSAEKETPTEAPVTYYHPELGVLPTMEELGLYMNMPYDEIVEKFGEPDRDVGSGMRWYEWDLGDEKKLYVCVCNLSADDKTYYAVAFEIGSALNNAVNIDKHLKND